MGRLESVLRADRAGDRASLCSGRGGRARGVGEVLSGEHELASRRRVFGRVSVVWRDAGGNVRPSVGGPGRLRARRAGAPVPGSTAGRVIPGAGERHGPRAAPRSRVPGGGGFPAMPIPGRGHVGLRGAPGARHWKSLPAAHPGRPLTSESQSAPASVTYAARSRTSASTSRASTFGGSPTIGAAWGPAT